MEKLLIEKTEDTPRIEFCKTEKKLHISGRSLPEDVTTFYQPALDWLDTLTAHNGESYKMDINLEYFNTASSKLILDILMKIEELHLSGNINVAVNWMYDKNDTDMQEAAEEYSELVEIPFTITGI